jgi:blocked early in transport 1
MSSLALNRATINMFLLNRFGPSHLHQRDPRSALFAGYTGDQARRPPSAQSGNSGYGYGYPGTPNSSLSPDSNGKHKAGYRPATPNKKGQYSDAVLNELESQNDAQVAGILGKVRVLKDVSGLLGSRISPSSSTQTDINERTGGTDLMMLTDDIGDWRRDPRLVCPGGENERHIRPDEGATTRNDESHAAHG